MNILLIGPPGAGKGTQAAVLQARLGMKHVASGDLFRRHMREESELGRKAKSFVDRGELVPDQVVIEMIAHRISEPDCEGGVIFDGFPRTRDQALALIEELRGRGQTIDGAVVLTAPRDVLLRRLVGRQTCSRCQTAYNIFYTPSRLEGVCDLCGGELYTRSDDNWETARHRLGVYQKETLPLTELFRDMGLLHEVDALGEVDEVTRRIADSLEGGTGPGRTPAEAQTTIGQSSGPAPGGSGDDARG